MQTADPLLADSTFHDEPVRVVSIGRLISASRATAWMTIRVAETGEHATPSLPRSSLLAFGLVGYGLRLYGYPTAPVVVRLILAPLAEVQFRRALQLSQGDVSVFVSSLISIILLTVAAIALILPAYLRWRGSGKALVQMAASED